eukprot:5113354-Alexandrium_andersonii.AAC.1
MSASLVGSEMCIRDRSPTMATTTTREWACMLPACCQFGGRRRNLKEDLSLIHILTLPTICSV